MTNTRLTQNSPKVRTECAFLILIFARGHTSRHFSRQNSNLPPIFQMELPAKKRQRCETARMRTQRPSGAAYLGESPPRTLSMLPESNKIRGIREPSLLQDDFVQVIGSRRYQVLAYDHYWNYAIGHSGIQFMFGHTSYETVGLEKG